MPDPPVFEMFFVNGTTMATVRWSHVPQNALRGPDNSRSYIVTVGDTRLNTTDNYVVVSGPRAATLTVKVGVACYEAARGK